MSCAVVGQDSESPIVVVDEAVSSPRGAHRQQRPSASVQTETEVDDNGNFSDCLVCHTVGELLCCDNCPRSYHPA